MPGCPPLLAALLLTVLAALAWSGPASGQGCPGGVPGSVRCIPAGATLDVDAYGTCRRLTNTRSLAMMVPLGSATEWAAAYGASGGVATVAPCYAYAWSGWSGWSGCSASCGGGSQSQSRDCLRTETGVAGSAAVDPGYCGGGPTGNTQSCNTQSCCTPSDRIDSYGGCNASCGGGSQDVYWSDGCGRRWTSSQICNTQGCTPPPTISWNYEAFGGQCRHIALTASQGVGGTSTMGGACAAAGRYDWASGGSFDTTFCDDGSRRGCVQTISVQACNSAGCTNSSIDIYWTY